MVILAGQPGTLGLAAISLLVGLLAGGLVDRIAIQLPVAMRRAWRGNPALGAPPAALHAPGGEVVEGLERSPPPWSLVRRKSVHHGKDSAQCSTTTRSETDQSAAYGLEPCPIALQSCTALSPRWNALSCAEPDSRAAESAPVGRSRFKRAVTRPLGVRLLCSGAFGLLAVRFGFDPALIAAMAATSALTILALIDARHQLLPDIVTYPFLGTGILVNVGGTFVPLNEAILGSVIGYASLWTLGWIYRSVFKRRGIGHGDLKLFAAFGAWLGWRALLPITQIAALLALLGILVTMRGRRALPRMVPYGAYLAAAGWIVLALGSNLPFGMLRP